MLKPGDVVLVDFPGVTGFKNRPAIVVSADVYHAHRPDVIVGLLTTQIASATAPMDYVLQDWSAAGLHRPSASRFSYRAGHSGCYHWTSFRPRLAGGASPLDNGAGGDLKTRVISESSTRFYRSRRAGSLGDFGYDFGRPKCPEF